MAALVAALLASCTSSPPDRRSCPTGPALVPSCGTLLGVSVGPETRTDLAGLEAAIGRRFDLAYEFNGLDLPLPTAEQRDHVAAGRILHLDLEAKEFALPDHPEIPWRDIVAGRWDTALRGHAAGLRDLGVPVMVTFDHEVDSPDKVGVRGTPGEFVAAWRHVHDVFGAAGATNVVWVWVVTGSPRNWPAVPSLYPGDRYVDWVSWDPYNASGCRSGQVRPGQWRSFAETVSPFYDWLATSRLGAGKPLMLSEFGTVADPTDPDAARRWYAEIPAALRRFPRIRAIQLWNSVKGACDYRIETRPGTLASFGELARAVRTSTPR